MRGFKSGSEYTGLYRLLQGTKLETWGDILPNQLNRILSDEAHGDLARWFKILEQLPDVTPSRIDLTADTVSVGSSDDCDAKTLTTIEHLLRQLHPWRKGPFDLFGIPIVSEWRSDWKWDRLKDWIQPLNDRLVLDVGCGNGYHCWRMAGAKARLTLGLDPSLLYAVQFHAMRHFVGDLPVHVLPLGIEALPQKLDAFDTVFSMGVFYHRRSPFDHLLELRDCLRNDGELVLETLVIDGFEGQVLVPENRYAKMRNIWFIPSCATVLAWLKRCGYRNTRVIDVTATTPEEQRSTDWMRFQSLSDFLQPSNQRLTVEGLPAPKRAIFLAEKP